MLIQQDGLHLGIISDNFIIRLLYHLGYTSLTKISECHVIVTIAIIQRIYFLMVCISPLYVPALFQAAGLA